MAEKLISVTIASASKIDSAECMIENTNIQLNNSDGGTTWSATQTVDMVGEFNYTATVIIQGATKWTLNISQDGVKKPLVDRSKIAPEGDDIEDQMSSEDPEAIAAAAASVASAAAAAASASATAAIAAATIAKSAAKLAKSKGAKTK